MRTDECELQWGYLARMRLTHLVLIALFTATRSFGQPSHAPFLGTLERFFTAMTDRDSAAMAATLLPGGSLQVVSEDGSRPVRNVPFSEYLSSLRSGKGRLMERYWDPDVRINGTIATIIAPYDFHIDGVFSHCGVDVFTLVRDGSGWRIANVAYTRRTEGCAPSPLGPLHDQ